MTIKSSIRVKAPRYSDVVVNKATGATYTPKILSDFVANNIVKIFKNSEQQIRVLDPAVGDGELLFSLLEQLEIYTKLKIEVCGFDTDIVALNKAQSRLKDRFPTFSYDFQAGDFLQFVLDNYFCDNIFSCFSNNNAKDYDIVIANPPYVRTQIMGAYQAQALSVNFGLSGRIDLYHAFIIAIARVLKSDGIAGIIVSNRFMSTRSGIQVRRGILENFNLYHIWDMGDTKLFNAAVLPAVLLVNGKKTKTEIAPKFTSIYETNQNPSSEAATPIHALSQEGVVKVDDGRRFLIQHGELKLSLSKDDLWKITTESADVWFNLVDKHTWGTFKDVGKIRVGVKTCADNIFIRSDWEDVFGANAPELLRPLTTHHVANRFKAKDSDKKRQILYPHEIRNGSRSVIDLENYEKTRTYLELYRNILEGRSYIKKAGRKWYELWVPQDPGSWALPKLVFRDIAEEPTFWIDLDGSVVNGDCYWMICNDQTKTDLLWLALAIGNSLFIEQFYDKCFHNKLYSGRRRFMSQYVERFPLPDPHSAISKKIVCIAKDIYKNDNSSCKNSDIKEELDNLIFKSFGLFAEKV